MTETIRKIGKKPKISVGDLVKVRSGKWKGIEDYVFSINSKKKVAYLKKASTEDPEKKKTSNKKSFQSIAFLQNNLALIK